VTTSPGDRLSQRDVDALFGTTPPAPEARPYDFLAAPQLPRERRLALTAALERLTPALGSLLSTKLQRPVDMTAGEPETVRAADVVHALPSPCVCFLFPVGAAQGLVDLGLPFSFHLIERLFGGEAQSPAVEARALTALERNAVQGVAEKLPALLREALRLPALGGVAGACESDPASLRLGPADQTMLVLRLELQATGLAAHWTLALPLAELTPLFATAPPATRAQPSVPGNGRELELAHVAVVARLPLFRMRAGAIAALAPGGLVPSGLPVDTPCEVLVNGRIRFRGTVGQSRGRLGLRITETVVTPLEARPERDRQGRAQ